MPPLARLLPGPRPDTALQLPAHRATGPPMAPTGQALGAQVAATPRAARAATDRVPRCDRRRHPPRPGLGGAVLGDDAHRRRPDELSPHPPRLLCRLLDRPAPA